MDINKIKQAALQVYEDCEIKSFPLSCASILAHYQLKLYSYQQLQEKSKDLYALCQKYSSDAFTYGTAVCFNDKMPAERIRFSLMHELGHLLLHTENETAASLFASHLLAPRIILAKAGYQNEKETSLLFGISKEAAQYALHDVQTNHLQWASIDDELLAHFYNSEEKIYVYKISECPVCGGNIYNSLKNTCLQCKKLSIKSR